MFEKEGYEWTEKNISVGISMYNPSIEMYCGKAFKEGAEFGYNKAKVEVEESYKESLCNSELNLASVTEQLEELEKANEWHYPSKGEYPDNNSDLLCLIDFETSEVGYFNEMFNNFFTIDGKELKVKAWKEIVLPKECE